ncbi:MAG: hypothetical protein U0269_08310 [Polyangiales bacterium]
MKTTVIVYSTLATLLGQVVLVADALGQASTTPSAVLVNLSYQYEPTGVGSQRPVNRGTSGLLAIDPIATTAPNQGDGFDATVADLQVVNQATVNIQPSAQATAGSTCWRASIRGQHRNPNNGVNEAAYLLRRDGRLRTTEFVEIANAGPRTIELLALRTIQAPVELTVKEYNLPCAQLTATSAPTGESHVVVASLASSGGSVGYSSELKGFPLEVNNFLRVVCDMDGGRYYFQAFDRGIISPRTNASCELIFDPWLDTELLSRRPVTGEHRRQLFWDTRETSSNQALAGNVQSQMLRLAGPQDITVQMQAGTAASTSRVWRVSTDAVARATRPLPWNVLPRYTIPRQSTGDSTELIITATTESVSDTGPAPSLPAFRTVIRPTGTVFLGGQNRWGNGVRIMATIGVAPFSVRLPAARSDLITSSSIPSVQVVPPRLATHVIIEPWNFRQRQNFLAPYFPVRFIAGFNFVETSGQVFAPSTLVGGGLAFPILTSESISALSASVSVNVFWEHDLREPQGNYVLVTTSLDLLSLLSPQSAPARTNAATNTP